MDFDAAIDTIGKAIDLVGVVAIVLGSLYASVSFVLDLLNRRDSPYRLYRRRLGRAILLGLEFLIAGDIIRTVAISPTFDSVAILAMIILVRSFLSLELELEIERRWPWQRKDSFTNGPSSDAGPRADDA